MADITVHMDPAVDHQAIERVRNTLSRLDGNDQITIIMESADAHQADALMELLRREGFDYQPRGTHDGRKYQVIARRIQ